MTDGATTRVNSCFNETHSVLKMPYHKDDVPFFANQFALIAKHANLSDNFEAFC